MTKNQPATVSAILPMGIIPLPIIIFFTSSTPAFNPNNDNFSKLYQTEAISDEELVDIVNKRFDPDHESVISAVFEKPDFLPFDETGKIDKHLKSLVPDPNSKLEKFPSNAVQQSIPQY